MVLVDSSIWIEYFKGNQEVLLLNNLIDTNSICINDIILAELLPAINHKNEKELKDILLSITKLDLNINWNHIIHMQTINLKNGINKVGITDLIIAQNSIDNDIKIYSLDKHFKLMSKLHGILLFN